MSAGIKVTARVVVHIVMLMLLLNLFAKLAERLAGHCNNDSYYFITFDVKWLIYANRMLVWGENNIIY